MVQKSGFLPLVMSIVVVAGCGSSPQGEPIPATTAPVNAAAKSLSSTIVDPLPDTAHPSCSADVITTKVPDEFHGNGFDRYYELAMNNQVVMRFLFQPSISQAQVEHVVRTTKWYLTNEMSTKYGADKSAVHQTLAKNQATMVIPDGTHVEGRDLGVRGQELYGNEITAPGSAWYTTNDPKHRDATLEEVFHQVHDSGIGTSSPGALPQYQEALLAEAKAAHKDGRWAKGSEDWYRELDKEGSLAQEYIASVIDNYYGMWAHRAEGSGYYAFNNRADVVAKDPRGAALLGEFLGPNVNAEAYLDPGFNGTFSMVQEPTVKYSHKSQYLVGARLTGTNPSGIIGNAAGNTLRGNKANNVLDGGAGQDTVIYCAPADRYTISSDGPVTTVAGPDGTDELRNVEYVHFADGPIPVPKK